MDAWVGAGVRLGGKGEVPESSEATPFVFTNLKTGDGIEAVTKFVEERGGLA